MLSSGLPGYRTVFPTNGLAAPSPWRETLRPSVRAGSFSGSSGDRGPPGMRRRHFRRREDEPNDVRRAGSQAPRDRDGYAEGRLSDGADAGATWGKMVEAAGYGLQHLGEQVRSAAERTWHATEGVADQLLRFAPQTSRTFTFQTPPGALAVAIILLCTASVIRVLRPLFSQFFGGRDSFSASQRLIRPQMATATGILVCLTAAAAFTAPTVKRLFRRAQGLPLSLSASSLVSLVLVGCSATAVFQALRHPWKIYRVLNALGFSWDERYGGGGPVRSVRDRSLAGREVVVSSRRQTQPWQTGRAPKTLNPLDPVDARGPPQENQLRLWRSQVSSLLGTQSAEAPTQGVPGSRRVRLPVRVREDAPDWWKPEAQAVGFSSKEARQQSKVLVQAMMAKRLRGLDFATGDIEELYRLWRQGSGTVTIDTENTRDELFRAAVGLGIRSSSDRPASPKIEGDSIPQFLAGLSLALQIPSARALTMILAAVAARTRSSLLQAWALYKQERDGEMRDELQKLASILQVLRPPLQSAEMEMLAQGLATKIPRDDRDALRWMFHLEVDKTISDVIACALGFM